MSCIHTNIIDETRQSKQHLTPYYHIEHDDRMHLVVAGILLDVVEVQQADKEQQGSVAKGDNDERDSTDITHFPVKL